MSNPLAPLLTGGALLVLGATAATADCREDLAAFQQEESTQGDDGQISKDGSLAPLETDAAGGAATTTEAAGEESAEAGDQSGIAKDGSLAPLQEDAAEASTGAEGGVAVSGQDAQAQQQAGASAGGDARADALARAEAALAEGDEEGCMAALEEARGS